MHGLIQAFSRTNRILNRVKTFGNIVCFRNLQKRVDEAISLFGDKNAGGIVLMKKFDDYYHGYTDAENKPHPGYVDMIAELDAKFPLSAPRVEGEQKQKEFISLFGAILRMRNLLSSFDEFAGKELLTERDLQDYLGRYQDLRDEWRNRNRDGQKEDITDDVVFEVELIRQIEINIDYILLLVKKYHDTHGSDKELLITIQKAVDASPELRSKKALIETFIAGINDVEDVLTEWHHYVAEEKEKELSAIIKEEKLKEEETRKFIANAFRNGEMKTTGTDIDKLMPPVTNYSCGVILTRKISAAGTTSTRWYPNSITETSFRMRSSKQLVRNSALTVWVPCWLANSKIVTVPLRAHSQGMPLPPSRRRGRRVPSQLQERPRCSRPA